MRKHLAWTEEQQAQLRALWADNIPIKEIASILGISPDAVDQKANRMKLPRRIGPNHKATAEALAIASNLHRIGLPISVIAKRLGVTRQTILNWINNPPRPFDPARVIKEDAETAE